MVWVDREDAKSYYFHSIFSIHCAACQPSARAWCRSTATGSIHLPSISVNFPKTSFGMLSGYPECLAFRRPVKETQGTMEQWTPSLINLFHFRQKHSVSFSLCHVNFRT